MQYREYNEGNARWTTTVLNMITMTIMTVIDNNVLDNDSNLS
jgi:hypothetical protein